MNVDGMKDASHMHKLRGPQAGRCREGWLVIVAGSGCSRYRDSWDSGLVAQRLRWPLQTARTCLPLDDVGLQAAALAYHPGTRTCGMSKREDDKPA